MTTEVQTTAPWWVGYAAPNVRYDDVVEIRGMKLYGPRAFKATTLMVGNPYRSTALCTSWADPWEVVGKDQIESYSIVAPLRTPSGIEVMLTNLARCPQIRRVAIWAGGKLNNTPVASLPRDYLLRLFRDGVDDNGVIRGTGFKLNESLVANGGLAVIRQILANVEIVGPVASLDQLDVLSAPNEGMYMDQFFFPELKVVEAKTLPSERVGLDVKEGNLFTGWLGLLDRIVRYGTDCQLETGGATVRELEFARVVLTAGESSLQLPDWVGQLNRLGVTGETLDRYYREKILPGSYMREIYPGVSRFERPPEISYLYSELLFAHPRVPELDMAIRRIAEVGGVGAALQFLQEVARFPLQNADEIAAEVAADSNLDLGEIAAILTEAYLPPVNQIKKIVERLNEMPDDADKMFVLWLPSVHGVRDRARPCWVHGSMLVRAGELDMKVTYRSHDVGKAWLENVYGVWRLWSDIASEARLRTGKLIVDSESAHLYLNDVGWVEKLVREQHLEQRPNKVFNVETMADPRGNWTISLVDGKIFLTLRDPITSQQLMVLEERTVRSMMSRLRHLGLIDQSDHALDIGMQLERVEVCRQLGIPYVQDKPLDLRRIRNLLLEH